MLSSLDFIYNYTNFRLSITHGNYTNEHLFDKETYEKVLFTRFVPICKQSMLQDEPIETNGKNNESMMVCSDFLPTITNHGICLSKNAANLDEIFKTNGYLSHFRDVFYHDRSQHEVKYIERDPAKHHFTFLVDGNSYNDLKRGKNWNAPLKTIFNLGIHSKKETADIRGWFDRIINIQSGYITKISIKPLEILADETLRSLDKEHRGCRFTEECNDLTSVKSYSKVNCLLDCKMDEAEKQCACRPWDYPTPNHINDSTTREPTKICDFPGNSCFNKILQENIESACHEKCVPNCHEISYSISMDKEPIDPENRICSYSGNPLNSPSNTLEAEIKKYMLSQFIQDDRYANNSDFVASSPPERHILHLLKKVLSKENPVFRGRDPKAAEYWYKKSLFEKGCKRKLKSDVAVVAVSIDSPKFTRMVKSAKVSFFDKLAILGKCCKSNHIHWYKSLEKCFIG